MIKVNPKLGKKVIKCAIDGTLLEVYESLADLAQAMDISTLTAYYRIKSSMSGRATCGLLLLYVEDWAKKFPMEASKHQDKFGDLVAPEQKEEPEEYCDNELELLSSSPVPKTTPVKNKAEPKKETVTVKQETKKTAPKAELKEDMVNHPGHYCQGGIECWDAMVATFGKEWMMAYATVNAFKYTWRAKHKGKFIEDMKKANWYNQRAAELAEQLEANE